MTYNVIVKSRFTRKIYERHFNVSPNGLMKIQDYYLFKPWIKVIAKKAKELEE